MVLPCNPYEGLSEEELKASLGMTYEDVALWVLEQQKTSLLDETSSVTMLSQAWQDRIFKKKFLTNPKVVIEKRSGAKISEDIEIQAFEETINSIHIVLPRIFDDFAAVNLSDRELSEFNMQMVLVGSTTNRDCCTYYGTCGGCSTD